MDECISVVVPVFNVEQYLEKCVSSITGQTYQDLEIILVDDGSTDRSGEICDEFAKRDTRVRVLHKKNGGNTSARKAGIKISGGGYLLFVDSDDWIEPDMCERLVRKASESRADIVRCALAAEDGKTGNLRKDGIPPGIYRTEEERRYVCENLLYVKESSMYGTNNSLCTQLAARRILMDVYNEIDNDIQYGEDLAFVILSILNADIICMTGWPLYHYRMRPGSITHASNPRYYCQITSFYIYLEKVFKKTRYSDLLLPQLEKFMDELVLRGINHRFVIPRKPRIPDYMFPLEKLCAGAKVAVYGAGTVGQSYMKQFRAAGIYEITCWVDKNYEKYRSEDMHVDAVGELKKKNYDYVVIAVKSQDLYRKIKEEIRREYNVDGGKTLWESPRHVLDYYAG